MEVAYVPSIHPLWTLCLLTELGSQRLISVGEENIRDSLFRREGKDVHLLLAVKGKSSLSALSLLPRTHIAHSEIIQTPSLSSHRHFFCSLALKSFHFIFSPSVSLLSIAHNDKQNYRHFANVLKK